MTIDDHTGENMDEIAGICGHVRVGDYPFSVELMLDEHLGLTDGIVACKGCGRMYLLEMLDWADTDRVFRIAPLVDDQARRLIRDLTRGSCDLNRADAEVQHLKVATAFAPCLLCIDTTGPNIRGIAPLPPDRALPGQGWRELACDGSWVRYARDHQDPGSSRSSTAMENG